MVVIIGIDPGLVHTGVVAIELDDLRRSWHVEPHVVAGLDVDEVKDIVTSYDAKDYVFIEAYRPRSHYGTDARMGKGVADMKAAIKGSTALDNTGVKQVVGQPLMEMLGVWKFSQTTHHQDLRSAARIGLYGALKVPYLNQILTEFVTDQLDGRAWTQL